MQAKPMSELSGIYNDLKTLHTLVTLITSCFHKGKAIAY